ncbi:DUF4469 domain-containing protein [Breznakiellaceae bacterium SP9]
MLLRTKPLFAAGTYRLEIATQFSHSATLLKEPQTITYDVDLTVN